MNAPVPHLSLNVQPLHGLLLGFLAPAETATEPQAMWLREHASTAAPSDALADWLRAPPAAARPLLDLVARHQLCIVELIALALVSAAETDAMAGRVMAWLQAPLPGSRPRLGLVARLAACLHIPHAEAQLMEGAARAAQLLRMAAEPHTTLPEAALHMPLPLVMALQGHGRQWPGVAHTARGVDSLAASLRDTARQHAKALLPGDVLVVRSQHPDEARAVCALMAQMLGRSMAVLDGAVPDGLGAWAGFVQAVPVFVPDLAPGDAFVVPELSGYRGPALVAAGVDGNVVWHGDAPPEWRLPLPDAADRQALWQQHLGDAALASQLAARHRSGSFSIEHMATQARHIARLDGRDVAADADARQALRAGTPGALGTLAELVGDTIDDGALVLAPALRQELESLAARCQLREHLADGLGHAARARYRPGVRALLVGPSGTGKTLAAGWLATRLGLPLYRVDVASVTSKYIGETEKNLARLFARAEHSEVVLLFDEADALFGKRTDVKDAHDRYANTQTNYLLQRMESFEGIALLTSNSRARFDTAFTRRLDAILEFPAPAPQERRLIWLAHLGDQHSLNDAQINQLAAACDLAGGQVRNASLRAAACAGAQARALRFDDVIDAVAAEYRKLGRQMPAGLQAGASTWV
ncbi:ATP-binding protein [Hydrogenophaga sp.]|uniref:AAA family ATPase n=1 Tax=Hydrogenophaga sp. TaxID=1904254 RepID=UPI002723FE22|nr:ATP-binding protein [Hydrogenophaga sp.]MDO9437329.1 ATP-binding protein [Hydrogenophaga sp.]